MIDSFEDTFQNRGIDGFVIPGIENNTSLAEIDITKKPVYL